MDELKQFCQSEKISMTVPFAQLSRSEQQAIIEGSDDWGGVRGFFDWLETKKYKLHVRVFLSKYRGYTLCPDCGGGRLRQEARDVKVGGKNAAGDLRAVDQRCGGVFSTRSNSRPNRRRLPNEYLFEIRRRLRFLVDVGLDYLTLDRLASTLSGGEAQRIQLATNLGSSLVGALYVLDEPSIGLHPRDNDRLIRLLQNLRDIGNTVLVVEHDEEMMRAADHILDIGPAAGELGGRVIYEGDFAGLAERRSFADRAISARRSRNQRAASSAAPMQKRRSDIRGAARTQSEERSTSRFRSTCSSASPASAAPASRRLIHDCIYAGLKKQRGDWQGHVGAFSKTRRRRAHRRCDSRRSVADRTHAALESGHLHQSLRRDPRSVCVNARSAGARLRSVALLFQRSRRTLRSLSGRRHGDGRNAVSRRCRTGLRRVQRHAFKQQILDIRYRGKNMHEVLNMTVREAITFFREVPKITNRLRVLDEVGLGYLRLGQSATTLSGGEAQRIKLAAHLVETNRRENALHLRRTDHRPALRRHQQTARRLSRA